MSIISKRSKFFLLFSLDHIHLNSPSLKEICNIQYYTYPNIYILWQVCNFGFLNGVFPAEPDGWNKRLYVCPLLCFSSDRLSHFGSLLALSFSLTCLEALLVPLLTHCSSVYPKWKKRRRRWRVGGDYLQSVLGDVYSLFKRDIWVCFTSKL